MKKETNNRIAMYTIVFTGLYPWYCVMDSQKYVLKNSAIILWILKG